MHRAPRSTLLLVKDWGGRWGTRTHDLSGVKRIRATPLPAEMWTELHFYPSAIRTVLPCFSTSDGRNTDEV